MLYTLSTNLLRHSVILRLIAKLFPKVPLLQTTLYSRLEWVIQDPRRGRSSSISKRRTGNLGREKLQRERESEVYPTIEVLMEFSENHSLVHNLDKNSVEVMIQPILPVTNGYRA